MDYIFDIPTPYYVIDEALVKKNLEILRSVKERTGCKILLAQKAFSCYGLYPLIGEYLDGTTASGAFEAMLGATMNKENHVFSAAYRADEIDPVSEICGHVVFNSVGQLRKYGPKINAAGKSIGLRINPECSTQEKAIYDPCSKGSRLGVRVADLEKAVDAAELIDGIHFHTLCEQNSDALAITLEAVEKKFSRYLKNVKWVNFGGGHHITRGDYDVELLVSLINNFRKKYNVQVYLEPGEAVVLNAGFLVSSVLDIVKNDKDILILDTSAACHMPDVLEVPYTPGVFGEGKGCSCRLAGNSCLAGDVIGDYEFEAKKQIGDKIIFKDMALYTIVKNNTFNGVGLPSIVISDGNTVKSVRKFGYGDFLSRLG